MLVEKEDRKMLKIDEISTPDALSMDDEPLQMYEDDSDASNERNKAKPHS